MRNFFIAFALSLFVISGPATADDETERLAREYVTMPEVRQMFDEMFSPQSVGAMLEAQLPPNLEISDEQRVQLRELFSTEMGKLRPRMESIMETTAAKVFSADEFRALIDFYRSPHGASVMKKMQPYMQQAMSELGPEMQKMQQDMAPRIIEILQPAQ